MSNYWHFGGTRLLLLTKDALIKWYQKIWAAPPHLIWTKSKRTAAFPCETGPKIDLSRPKKDENTNRQKYND